MARAQRYDSSRAGSPASRSRRKARRPFFPARREHGVGSFAAPRGLELVRPAAAAAPQIQRRVFAGRTARQHVNQMFSTQDVRRLDFRHEREGSPPRLVALGRAPLSAFDDAFRARLMRELLESDHDLNLLFQSIAADTPEHDLLRGGQTVAERQTWSLYMMGRLQEGGGAHADGVTILSPELAANIPNYTGPVSRRANRSYIVYTQPASLAHELFGHFYLATRGSQSGHGRDVTPGRGVQEPGGAPFTGSVNEFIEQQAADVRLGVSDVRFSPTRRLEWNIPTQTDPFVGTYTELMQRYPGARVDHVDGRYRVTLPEPPTQQEETQQEETR